MTTDLDNKQTFMEVDKSNMLADLAKTPAYCKDAIQLAKQVNVPKGLDPKNVVVLGMGGSAIGGELLMDWLADKLLVPIQICRDYTIPAYVNKDTLVFANSYSGNTEETISAFLEAVKRKCTILAVTSGGQLGQFCSKLNIPTVTVPKGLQPRAAVPYLFFPLAVLMQKLGLITAIDAEMEETIKVIESVGKANAPDVPLKVNKAKQVAAAVVGTIPVIYGFGQYTGVANRIKCQFNENSKIPSKAETFPELNHNETVGYDAPKTLTKNLTILLIRDPEESAELKNRIDATNELVFQKTTKTIVLAPQGTTKLARMFSIIVVGDYASVYLAVLQNKDPTPVKIIDQIKQELANRSHMKEKFDQELAKLG
jgi:glucose/mannose-6-phosphate isomerase